MKKKYGDCFYCGGVVDEQFLSREVRWHGQLFVFENVPMGICRQCGEKILTPNVAKTIDRILLGKRSPAKTIKVPVFYYDAA